MISPQALHQLLDKACRAAAEIAVLRIPDYDLPRVERYLDMMAQNNLATWKPREIIAAIESRTMAGCPDPDDPELAAIMENCFNDAVKETKNQP